MEETKKQNITFEGKEFQFLSYFADGAIYSCGNIRLITNSDGSVYGTYQTDRKGVRVIL